MTDMTITTWAVAADRDGAPLILAADPNEEEARSALALVRLNRAAKRYSVEPVGITDHGFAARLAREAIAAAFPDGADWTRVRPTDLAPKPVPAEPPAVSKGPDRGAVRPGHPMWAAEARELLDLGLPPQQEDFAAARERLLNLALAEGWSLRELGHAILRERAEAADRIHISALHVVDQRDPIALALGEDDSAAVWARVVRPPKPGETTLADRMREGF